MERVFRMELRTKLNALKEKHGLTNQQISDASGVPLGTVSGIFSGQTARPAFQDIVAILASMGESIDGFCGVSPAHAPAETENAPQPFAAEHHHHHFHFSPLKAEARELMRESLEDVYASDAYKILNGHLRWWRTIAIVLIALVLIWFTWDITHPRAGLIQYSNAQPAVTTGMADDEPLRL